MVQVIGQKTLGVRDIQSIQACSSLNSFQSGNNQIIGMSFNLYICIVLWFLNSFIFNVLDLEIPRDKCMHLTRYRAWERSNPRSLIRMGKKNRSSPFFQV